mgnify:CR=1 FL=1
MAILEEYDWMLINELSFKIHTISDPTEMRRTVLERLHQIIHFDRASFYLLSDWDNNYKYFDPIFLYFDDPSLKLYKEN